MNDLPHPLGDDSKRRKLDDLFADQPFLSPTMRARLLHERIRQAQSQSEAAQGLPQEAFVTERAPAPPVDQPMESVPEPLAPRMPAVKTGGMVSLADTAAYLRTTPAPLPVAEQVLGSVDRKARLVWFRDQVLNQWLKRVPAREIR